MIAVCNLDNGGGPGTGALGGPPMQHNYKRAVYRAAPQAFSTEVLPPTKVGSTFAYGLRIYPITGPELPDDQSGQSSGSSGSMHTEYDVWRRWEDCLWFQEIIEEEYEQMARAKRSRLAAGKGVKKNGVYVHSDQAASFESLPPGPEAGSIARGIHEIIPKLTKKGTFFRASQSTVDQRGREFCAMIQALFADDVPTLVKELRETRLVRDFFGYWRRDKDLERKRNMRPASSPGAKGGVRSSSASTMSMYFSASNLSLTIPEPPPNLPRSWPHTSPTAPMPASAPPDLSASSSSVGSLSPTTPTQEIPAPMHFSVSDRGSLALAHPPSEDELQARYSIGPRSVSSKMSSLRWSRATSKQSGAALIDDLPFVFVPESQGYHGENRGGLQSLPEDQELVPEASGMTVAARDAPLPARRPRGNSCPERDNRNFAVYVPPTSRVRVQTQPNAERSRSRPSSPAPSTATVVESTRPESVLSNASLRSSSGWRDSMASDLSFATEIASGLPCGAYFDDGQEGTVRARSPREYQHAARASVATMNSLMSGYSVDAVLPRRASPPPPPPIARRSQQPVGSRRPVTVSSVKLVPREEVWCEAHEELLDAYFDEMSLRSASPVDSAYRFPREDTPSRLSERTIVAPHPSKASPSPQPSLTPTFTKSHALNPDSITVKAVLNDSIVLVRVSYSMSFLEVRERIQEKFANQEGIPLPGAFAIAYAPPVDRARYARGRARSNSASTVGSGQVQPLRYIASDEEWHTAVVGCASKLTVRIFQSRH